MAPAGTSSRKKSGRTPHSPYAENAKASPEPVFNAGAEGSGGIASAYGEDDPVTHDSPGTDPGAVE